MKRGHNSHRAGTYMENGISGVALFVYIAQLGHIPSMVRCVAFFEKTS
jgi:hypothetical protein